jgi:hypothetical protein
LADKFPQLYTIYKEQDATVETMKRKRWHITFRRWWHEDLQNQLRRLHDILIRCGTNEDKDRQNGIWKNLVCSLLNQLINCYANMNMVPIS